ncbi:hypothetical protein LacP0734_01545 [Lacticaseibacillus paracasei subsp. tolerans]|uniref:hypothetical protein n=1 Tax=Lacticaseibacillus paracasei TaxID=1597 RepID=UPI001892D199|nr:hypothetical protein [Lacticaseibacillus paracasei]QPC19179.1 hypothetical protein LacP0734_01545 [Lacticaseibacillus paracasei subsp. tolerans]
MKPEIHLKALKIKQYEMFFHSSVIDNAIDSTGEKIELSQIRISSQVRVGEPGTYPVFAYFDDPVSGQRIQSETKVTVLPYS